MDISRFTHSWQANFDLADMKLIFFVLRIVDQMKISRAN